MVSPKNSTEMKLGALWNCLVSFTRLPLFHRTPCFQQDFGKRTRRLKLPLALSTENTCSRTWRSKPSSTKTEKTSSRSQGKRKVPSILVSVFVTDCLGTAVHLAGLFVEHTGTNQAVTAQGEAQESDLELWLQQMKRQFHPPRSGLLCYPGVTSAGLSRSVGGHGDTQMPAQRRARPAAARSPNASVFREGWTEVATLTSLGLFPC